MARVAHSARSRLSRTAVAFVTVALTMWFGMLWSSEVAAATATVAATASAPPPAVAEPDEPATDSPRASMQRYLELCRKNSYAEAAHYLDVPKSVAARSTALAEELCAVLSRFLWIDPDSLSPESLGKKEPTLPATTNEVGQIADKAGRKIPVRIVRREVKDEDPRWVFNQQTVLHTDEWYERLDDRWLRQHLPAVLLREGPKSLLVWQWIAIPLLLAVCWLLGRFLASGSQIVLARIAKATPPKWDDRLVVEVRGPLTLTWLLALFFFAEPYLNLYLAAEHFIDRAIRAAFFLAFFWFVAKGVTALGHTLSESPASVGKPNVRALGNLAARAGRIAVFAIAVVAILNELGYPVASVITGLGIGGIALALAAQKTLENLFGSVAILVDQPFRIGDTIRVDGVEGTVETIGLRSTRVRTYERTLVIWPNGKLADMRIESFATRDRFRLLFPLLLRPDTAPSSVEAFLTAVRGTLLEERRVRKDDAQIRVKGLSPHGLEIEVNVYLEVPTAAEFAQEREAVVLVVARLIAKQGLALASPREEPALPTPPPIPS